MKRLLKTLSVLVIGVAAIAVAGVAILLSQDFNQYKGLAQDQVKKATGRDLEIKGDIDLKISLSPALVVEGVRLSNAPWAKEPAMLDVGRFEAEVALIPLLKGQVDVARLVLKRVTLNAETDARGMGNWQLGAAATASAAPTASPESGAPGGGPLPVVRNVRAEDVTVNFRDGRSGEAVAAKLASLDLGAPSAATPLDLKAQGSFNGQPFAVAGQAGSIESLLAAKDLPLDLTARFLGAEVRAKGRIADLAAFSGIALEIDAAVASLKDTAASARALSPKLGGIPAYDLGALTASVSVAGSLEKLGLSALNLNLEKQGLLSVKLTGGVADVFSQTGIDVGFAAQVPNPPALAALLEAEAPPLPALKASGRVGEIKEGYALEDLALTLGESSVTGNLGVRLGGERPRVAGKLAAGILDLDALLPPPAASVEPAPPPADGRLFPNDPLPFELLKTLDASLHLDAEAVRISGQTLTRVVATASLRDGGLRVKPVAFDLAGGRVTVGVIHTPGKGAAPQTSVRVQANRVDYGKLLAELAGQAYAKGDLDLQLDVEGSGTTVREIMAGLSGKLRLTTKDGEIDNKLLNILSADVASALPLVDSSGDKHLKCAVVHFEIKDGLAPVHALVAETGGLSVVGAGGLSLKDETLNLVFEPRAKKTNVLDLGLLPVAVRGTFLKPKPKVNPADIVGKVGENAARVGAAIATFGLSELALGGARAVDRTDYCKAALAGRKVTPSSGGSGAEAEPKSPVETVTDGVGGAVEGVGKTLKGIGEGIGGGIKGLFGR